MKRAAFPLRFALVAAMLVATLLFLHARSQPEQLPRHLPLSTFPSGIAGWSGQDVPIDNSIREVLGQGDFVDHIYARAGQPPVELFLAYFPSQRTGNSIHSPKNCLPGSGWSPLESGHLQLNLPHSEPLTMNRYIVAKGAERQLVLYWYQARNRTVASEYWAKIYLVTDAIRLNRTDGALVRLNTAIGQDESADVAQDRAAGLVVQIVSRLDEYIPR